MRSVGPRGQVSFAEIPSPYGHDAFLLEPEEQRRYIEPFLTRALFEAHAEVDTAVADAAVADAASKGGGAS